MKRLKSRNTLIVGIFLFVVATVFSLLQNACPTKPEKKTEPRVANFDVVKTPIKIGPNEERTISLNERWSPWITIDPRTYFAFSVEGEGGEDLKFQFRNGTETPWISPDENIHLGEKPWTKTFRVRLERGVAELVIVTGSVRGSKTSLTIPH